MAYGTKAQYRELIRETEDDLAYWEYYIPRKWEQVWRQGKIDHCRSGLAEAKHDIKHAR